MSRETEHIKVKVFSYTQHFVDGKLSEKMGSCCLFRRALEGREIVTFIIETRAIAQMTSDTLTRLLEMQGASFRKNLTKPNKIRQLMKLAIVQKNVSAEDLASLEQHLQAMEKKKNRKTHAEPLPEEGEEMRFTELY